MEDTPIAVPENLVLSIEEIDQIDLAICPICGGVGFPYKYPDKQGRMKYFIRCRPGCILTETAFTIEELNKKWDKAVIDLLLLKDKTEKLYGQKKVHNGKGK